MKEQIVRLTQEAKEAYPQFEGREDYEESQVMFEMSDGNIMLFQPLYNRKIWEKKYLDVVKEWTEEE